MIIRIYLPAVIRLNFRMLPFIHTHTATYYMYMYMYVYDVFVTLLCAESASSGKRRLKSLKPEIFQIRGEHNIIIINGRGLNVSNSSGGIV